MVIQLFRKWATNGNSVVCVWLCVWTFRCKYSIWSKSSCVTFWELNAFSTTKVGGLYLVERWIKLGEWLGNQILNCSVTKYYICCKEPGPHSLWQKTCSWKLFRKLSLWQKTCSWKLFRNCWRRPGLLWHKTIILKRGKPTHDYFVRLNRLNRRCKERTSQSFL